MPAQFHFSHGQLVAMADLGYDVIVTEGPNPQATQAIDVWVLDEESVGSNTHRSVVLDAEGNILGDTQMED